MQIPLIANEAKLYIQNKLQRAAQAHNIRILVAVESGSRAWGFPSIDSDYDIRFVYVHNVDHYLSIDHKRDVIETEIEFSNYLKADFDMNGWDLKKMLQLALKGNAVVNEWLTSPIIYSKEDGVYNALFNFIQETANLSAYLYFYKNYMNAPIQAFLGSSDKIKLKDYCYLIRSAVAIRWIEVFKSPPPMDLPSMISKLELDEGILSEIKTLVSLKKTSTEKDTLERSAILDSFIQNSRDIAVQRPPKEFSRQEHLDLANKLFKNIVLGSNSLFIS